MIKIKTTKIVLGAAVLLGIITGIFSLVWAQADDFPSKTITWIVPTRPGGGYDTFSRAIAPVMAKYLPGHPNIIIKNIPGAGGRRGNSILYRSKPDGHTIGTLIVPGALVYQMIDPQIGYDINKLTWLGLFSQDVYDITVSAEGPFKTVQDLIKGGEKVKFGTPGKGTTGHVVTLIVNRALGINGRVIGIKGGSAPAITALLRGDIHAVLTSITSFLSLKEAGEVRYLATLTSKRNVLAPDVPTLPELGYPELNESFSILRPLAGPPNVPEARAKILEEALLKALSDPGLRKWSKKAKRPLVPAGSAEIRKTIATTNQVLIKYKDLLKE